MYIIHVFINIIHIFVNNNICVSYYIVTREPEPGPWLDEVGRGRGQEDAEAAPELEPEEERHLKKSEQVNKTPFITIFNGVYIIASQSYSGFTTPAFL
jgi:hypothetical protein